MLEKQPSVSNITAAFGKHSIIIKLRKDNEANKPGTELAAASTSLPSDASLLNPRYNTTRTCSSTASTKLFEQIYFVFNEIRLCDCNAYKKGGLGVGEFKSAGIS